MAENIGYYLDLEDEDFDLDGATKLLRDMRVELAPYRDRDKYLAKLEKRIKGYIRDTGQAPQVKGLRMDIIPKRDSEFVTVKDTQLLAGALIAEGQKDIADRVMALVKTKPNTPAIKFIYEDIEYK
jgi:hypothetical protein